MLPESNGKVAWEEFCFVEFELVGLELRALRFLWV